MRTIIPMLLGDVIAILWFLIGKGNTELEQVIITALKGCPKGLSFLLRFSMAVPVLLCLIPIFIIPVVQLGLFWNSAIAAIIISVELFCFILGAAARQAHFSK